MTKKNSALLPEVDVELILEGSYPYVTGGVSSWVHRLIVGLPEIRFGLIHLAAKKGEKREIKYQLPENVLSLQNLYLHDPVFIPSQGGPKKLIDAAFFADLFSFHSQTQKSSLEAFSGLIQRLSSVETLPELRDLFLASKPFLFWWRCIRKRHQRVPLWIFSGPGVSCIYRWFNCCKPVRPPPGSAIRFQRDMPGFWPVFAS